MEKHDITIKVFSQKAIELYVTDDPHIVISIREPNSQGFDVKPAELPDNPNRVGTLWLDFCDMDCRKSKPEHLIDVGYKLFTIDDAKSIIKFVELTYPYINKILVNCPGGISRSSAVAAAITKILGYSDEQFFDPRGAYRPNMYVYRTILNTYLDMRPIGE
jgi:predicted protein tyrosine phosphatase